MSLLLAGAVLAGCGRADGKANRPQAQADASVSQSQEAESTYQRGTQSRNQYVSEWKALSFIPDDGLALVPESELFEKMGVPEGTTDFSDVPVVYEMNAYAPDDTSIAIIAEKAEDGASEEDYIEKARGQLERYLNVETKLLEESSSYMLNGAPYAMATYEMRVPLLTEPLRQTILVDKKEDRMYQIVVTYCYDSTLQVILSYFDAL